MVSKAKSNSMQNLRHSRIAALKCELFHILWDSSADQMALAEVSFDSGGYPQDCYILEVNPSFLAHFGVAREETIGRRITDFLPECGPQWPSLYAQAEPAARPTGNPEQHLEGNRRDDVQVIPLDADRRFMAIVRRCRGLVVPDCSASRQPLVGSAEWEAAELLQDLSTKLTQEDNVDALYDHVLITVMRLLKADLGSIQLFFPERGAEGEVHLHGHRGFNGYDLSGWEWIPAGAPSSCGLAMRTRKRVVLRDVLECDLMAGGMYLEDYHRVGIRAVVTTPLLSRTGALLGLFSAYWRTPRGLTASEARILDIIARQAADLVELQKSRQEALDLVEELRRADENRTAFLATLSHELRNPLAAITMGNSLLRNLSPTCTEAIKARDIIERQTVQLSRLVDDLLDTTRVMHNRLVLRKQRVELNRVVSAAVADYQTAFAARGVRFGIRLHREALYTEADAARLIQILGNLLNNAVKFTPSDGKVTVCVTADVDRGEAVISVSDTGIGIDHAVLPFLFKPFMQADCTLDRRNGGLGLGLALVKGITELHGGSAQASSEGPGKGAEFTIRLPLAESEDNPQEVDARPEVTSARPLRILVIEDNPDFAAIMVELLTLLGHEAILATSGPEGMAKTRAVRPDVVLCDLGLPVMNGYEVAAGLRKDEELRDSLLVAVSGYAQPEDVSRAMAAGFDRHLAKPVDLSVLTALLAEIVRNGK